MSEAKTPKEPSRADELAASLRAEILRGRYRPGDRLPSERELATRNAVNRLLAREALQQLERLGLVEIRRGGPRVSALRHASPDVIAHLFDVDAALDPSLVGQWLDVSELIYTGAVRLAVERAPDEWIARARDLLRALLKPGTENATYFATLDELGDLIYAGADNLVLQLIRNGLKANVLPRLQGGRERLRPVRGDLSELVRAIDKALVARDPEAVQEAVRSLYRANKEKILKAVSKEQTRTAPPRGRR